MKINDAILKIKNLNVEFPLFGGIFQREVSAVHAVKNASLDIPKGKTIGVVGESGSGKSTLGKAIINVLKLTAPDVRVSGNICLDENNNEVDILSLNREEILKYRSKIQMIFQDPFSSLNPRMIVKDIIQEPLDLHTSLSKSEKKEWNTLKSTAESMKEQEVFDYMVGLGARNNQEWTNKQGHQQSARERLGKKGEGVLSDSFREALISDAEYHAQNKYKGKTITETGNLMIDADNIKKVTKKFSGIFVLHNSAGCEIGYKENIFKYEMDSSLHLKNINVLGAGDIFAAYLIKEIYEKKIYKFKNNLDIYKKIIEIIERVHKSTSIYLKEKNIKV